jgi:hypothetical protein
MRPTLSACILVGFGLVATACGGDSPTGGGTPPPGGGREIKADPSFSSDIVEIFNRTGCSQSSCHGSASQGGLDLRASAAYGELVNVAAEGEPSKTRVIPGDAQNSYLVIKLEGRQSFGSQMPEGGTPLDNIDLSNVRNWITQGAQNN